MSIQLAPSVWPWNCLQKNTVRWIRCWVMIKWIVRIYVLSHTVPVWERQIIHTVIYCMYFAVLLCIAKCFRTIHYSYSDNNTEYRLRPMKRIKIQERIISTVFEAGKNSSIMTNMTSCLLPDSVKNCNRAGFLLPHTMRTKTSLTAWRESLTEQNSVRSYTSVWFLSVFSCDSKLCFCKSESTSLIIWLDFCFLSFL